MEAKLFLNYGSITALPATPAILTLPLTFVTVISGLVLLLKTMTRILLFSVRIIHSCNIRSFCAPIFLKSARIDL